ncbi:MAG: diguanylate cyclase [Elusimicrobiota bacterium]
MNIKNIRNKIDSLITEVGTTAVTVSAFTMVLLIGILDAVTGVEIFFRVFYLLPIGLAAWYVGRKTGYVVTVASSICWLLAEVLYDKSVTYPFILLWNMFGRFALFLIASHLISELKERIDFETKNAMTDALTGINNRRFFNEMLQREAARAERYKHPLTIAYIDVDDFKSVNDNYGHHEGDRLLGALAKVISESVRNTDMVSRIGGDEFVIMFPETYLEDSKNVVNKIVGKYSEAEENKGYRSTLSIGVATFIRPSRDAEGLVRKADEAMYLAKRTGKNRAVYEAFGE